jgi:hypothetical protein
VFASLEGQGWANEADHQVCSSVYGSVRPECKANMRELLKEQRVCISGRTLPRRTVVQSLVEALGGTVVLSESVATLRIAGTEHGTKRHHNKTTSDCERGDARTAGVKVVDTAWLIDAVVSGELPDST